MQPRLTEVPPTRDSSASMTRAPEPAAIRPAAPPPEPPPTTKRSTSCSAISSDPPHLDVVTSFFHFGAHFGDDLLRQVFGPSLRIFHALIQDGRLLHDQLAAERRLVEGQRVLELLLREP